MHKSPFGNRQSKKEKTEGKLFNAKNKKYIGLKGEKSERNFSSLLTLTSHLSKPAMFLHKLPSWQILYPIYTKSQFNMVKSGIYLNIVFVSFIKIISCFPIQKKLAQIKTRVKTMFNSTLNRKSVA